MQIILYNNHSAQNVVHKSKTQIKVCNGVCKENVNRESAVFTISYFADWQNINYAYVPEFARYYYVSVDLLNGMRLKLTMKSDALSSFWGNYKTSQCIAKRSTSNFNPDISDECLKFKSQPIYIRRKTSSKFTPTSNSGSYILTVGGK